MIPNARDCSNSYLQILPNFISWFAESASIERILFFVCRMEVKELPQHLCQLLRMIPAAVIHFVKFMWVNKMSLLHCNNVQSKTQLYAGLPAV